VASRPQRVAPHIGTLAVDRQAASSSIPDATLAHDRETLHGHGAHVEVVHPDAASEATFATVGGNVLDPAVREHAARAGREQGRTVAPSGVAALWREGAWTFDWL
jgi:hypothetical protein